MWLEEQTFAVSCCCATLLLVDFLADAFALTRMLPLALALASGQGARCACMWAGGATVSSATSSGANAAAPQQSKQGSAPSTATNAVHANKQKQRAYRL